MHPVEECSETLAFATEPVLASLANVLAFQVTIRVIYDEKWCQKVNFIAIGQQSESA